MKLSERLRAITSFIEKNSIVADVGTDHGYIPAYLIKNKISKKVIGTDISRGSLDKIIAYVDQLGLGDKIDTRLGDGLEPIRSFEVDSLILAGMGGLLISDILDKNKQVSKSIINFVFQPMVAGKELREYLINNNFVIEGEDLVKEEDKYYEIIYARHGKQDLEKEIHLEISPLLIKANHPLVKEFVEFKIKDAEKIVNSLEGIDTSKSRERHEELTNQINRYLEVLDEIQG